jgi:hypothetical protein
MANRVLSILFSVVLLFSVAPDASAGFRVKKQADVVSQTLTSAQVAGNVSVETILDGTTVLSNISDASSMPIRRMQRTGLIGLFALICGVLGFFHPIFAIGAIILGIIGMSRKNWKTGLAIIGFILGLLAIALSVFSSYAPLPIF